MYTALAARRNWKAPPSGRVMKSPNWNIKYSGRAQRALALVLRYAADEITQLEYFKLPTEVRNAKRWAAPHKWGFRRVP